MLIVKTRSDENLRFKTPAKNAEILVLVDWFHTNLTLFVVSFFSTALKTTKWQIAQRVLLETNKIFPRLSTPFEILEDTWRTQEQNFLQEFNQQM